MMRFLERSHLALAARGVLVFVFGFSGAVKVGAALPGDVPQGTIVASITRGSLTLLCMLGLAEVSLATSFAVGWWMRTVSLVGVAACSLFGGIVWTEYTKPAPRPCGCIVLSRQGSGTDVRTQLRWSLGLDGLLAGACVTLYALGSRDPEPATISPDPFRQPAQASGAGVQRA